MEKRDIMRHKLAAQIMKKSSFSAAEWDSMADDEIMKLTQFPIKVRVSIIEHRKTHLTANDLESKLVESRISSTDVEVKEDAAEVYDPEAPVIKILAEQVEISSEEGITKILYTKDELQSVVDENGGDNTNWLIVLKKAASVLDKDRIDNDLLTELAKEKAQSNKSKKK
jgi:hypothetical protein